MPSRAAAPSGTYEILGWEQAWKGNLGNFPKGQAREAKLQYSTVFV